MNGEVVAVHNLNLTIKPGEFVALLGPSGCGKTTTLRCIAGLEQPDQGEITVNDKVVFSDKQRINLPPEKRDLSMVFQSYAIWPHMTVFENVAYGLRFKKNLSAAEIREKTEAALELVGLKHLISRYATDLSGGQQQRVAVARSIVLEPAVMLFDEPLSNLDAKLREYMRFELRNLQQQLKTTSIYVTHDQEEAMAIADRIVLMNEGEIVQSGSPEELYWRPNSEFAATFIGSGTRINGIVEDVDESQKICGIKLDGGIKIHAPLRPELTVGTRVHTIFRPEAFRPGQGEGSSNNLPLLIKDYKFLGSTINILGELENVQFNVRLPSIFRDTLEQGAVVPFHVDVADVICIVP